LSARPSQFWTDNESKHKALIEEGYSDSECAARLGVSKAAARQKRQSYGIEAPKREVPESVLNPTVKKSRLSDVCNVEPAPFAVEIAKAPQPTPGNSLSAVVFGDTQIPFQDDKCLSVIEGVIAQVKPDILLHMGDVIDCWQISDYDRDPNLMGSLQDNIDATRTRMHRWSQLAPKARRVLLKGNHEDRLQRLIWRLPDTARELAKLRAFREAMTWPRLLDLDGIGWEWIEEDQQSHAEILPKLIAIHGHQLKGATTVEGAAARKAMQKYGRSVIVGHHHRACVIARRDHNGQAFGIETGCSCLLDGQPWGRDFNWQQAVTVLEWSSDRKVMHAEQIIIRSGRAICRGKDYRAA
jgi:predicted phosphodiesterase